MKLNNTIVMLQPGMYILRHPKGGLAPLTIGRAPGGPGSVGRVEVISTPSTQGTILRDGADCIVMHVMHAPVELLVTAYLAHEDAAVPALRLDRIGLDDGPQPTLVAPAASLPALAAGAPIEVAANGISVIGHIERTGDVLAGVGQALGDPRSGLRLEGFQVVWPDRPEGVDLAYTASVESVGALPLVTSGSFCGTKREGRRITDVTFALMGPKAAQYRVVGEAHFSGGFHMPIIPGVALSGPSGMEHLTALRLAVVAGKPQTKSAPSAWDASPRTKVIKTKVAKK